MFDLLELEELPKDFFLESLTHMAGQDHRCVIVPDGQIEKDTLTKNVMLPEISPLVIVDYENDCFIAGERLPAKPEYEVYHDPQPAIVVLEWVKNHFSGGMKEFPIVPVGQPIIPASRYEKIEHLVSADEQFLAKGCFILDPTPGQTAMFPLKCVNFVPEIFHVKEIPNLFLNLSGEWIKDSHGFYILIQSQEESNLISRWKQVEAEFYDDIVVVCPPAYYRDFYKLRYYTRHYKSEYNDAPVHIVGFDLNPYSPYGVRDLQSFAIHSNRTVYKTAYKERYYKGCFHHVYKRYHSDVWFPLFFNDKEYNKGMMSLDLVTNSFHLFEAMFDLTKVTIMNTLMVPYLVEPFVVKEEFLYKKVMNSLVCYRSPIRYKLNNIMVIDFDLNISLPYSTIQLNRRLTFGGESFTYKKLKYVNKFYFKKVEDITLFGKKYNVEEYKEKCLQEIRNYKLGLISVSQYDFFCEEARKFFFYKQRYKLKGKKSVNTLHTTVYKMVSKEDSDIALEMIPYKISRYPHNFWMSLIPSFTIMTMEFFMSKYAELRQSYRYIPPFFHTQKRNIYNVEKRLEYFSDDEIDDMMVSTLL